MGRDEGWQLDCRDSDGHALPSWRFQRGEPVRVSKRENWSRPSTRCGWWR